MKHLVIGLGEVGKALQKILSCDGIDKHDGQNGSYDAIHICFPYSATFASLVNDYKKFYNAEYVVVHSTVPVGTCDANHWIHSPIRGIHPNLEEGIRTFVKYFGGANSMKMAAEFADKGIKSYPTHEARTTEAMKLWDTTIYGWNILLEKIIHAYCEKRGLDFSLVYSMPNATYNEGYTALGHPEFTKYVLRHIPGPIGGHCVRENWELLDDEVSALCKELHTKLVKDEEVEV